jgi:hypothetical protein
MGAKKGFQTVVLDNLSDEEVNTLVLSNWHKLNAALKNRQSVDNLRRLFRLELARLENARPNVLERIRSSLWRALTVRSKASLKVVLTCMTVREEVAEDEVSLKDELVECGLSDRDAVLVEELVWQK